MPSEMDETERLETMRCVIVMLQMKAKYSVWLPSGDVLTSVEDLLSRRMNLSKETVRGFVTTLEDHEMGVAEICDLMPEEVMSIFGLDETTATVFVDGLDYIIEMFRLENLDDASLAKCCAETVRLCVESGL